MFAGALDGDLGHVGVDHEVDELFECCLFGGVPAESLAGLGGVAPEVDDVGGAVEVGRYLDYDFAGLDVDAFFVLALAFEAEFNAGATEGVEAEFAHGGLLTGGDDEVFGGVLLEYEPHALDVVAGVAPVAEAGEVAQVEFFLFALGYAGGCEGDFAGDESFAAALGLVVEEYAGAGVHVVGLAVFLDNPEAVELGYGVGAVGVEGGVLVLGHFLDLAVELRCGGLVEAAGLGQAALADAFEDAEDAGGVDVGCEFGRVEAYLDMALGGEVVDFVGTHLVEHLDYGHGVAQVGVVQVEVGVALEVGYAFAVVDGGAAYGAVYVISFFE